MTAKIDGTNGVLQQYDYQASTTGFSYTFASGTTVLVLNPAGTLATGTITMPATPADGMTISISSTQTITALTINGNSGQSIVGKPTTLVAGGSATFVYRLSNTTWYTQTNTAALGSAAIAGGFSNMVVITSTNASYSIPAAKIKITVIGGGGGSGGTGTQGQTTAGGGGGGGGTAVKILSGLTIGSTLNVTIGAGGTAGPSGGNGNGVTGGTSSVASNTQVISTVSATGGGGTIGTQLGDYAASGAGGLGSGGDLNIRGGSGVGGGDIYVQGGLGGSTTHGGGGKGSSGAGGQYGGGGGGFITGGGGAAGGAGAAGVVIVEY